MHTLKDFPEQLALKWEIVHQGRFTCLMWAPMPHWSKLPWHRHDNRLVAMERMTSYLAGASHTFELNLQGPRAHNGLPCGYGYASVFLNMCVTLDVLRQCLSHNCNPHCSGVPMGTALEGAFNFDKAFKPWLWI